ncbi:MAG: hypothetical protein J6S40_05405 [Thermoguttaceae bacterium]|nr:hypothetical protein [Thermoguttaceae bacterium]
MLKLPLHNRLSATVCLLLAATTLPFCASCQSKGYIPGPNDPFAENAPKTKEEEEYYRDVLSGDWQKQTSNPLGYFGLGRSQVSTSPPPHWTMAPPAGAKTMEEIRSETYERRIAEEKANFQKGADLEGRVYKTAAVDQQRPAPTRDGAQHTPGGVKEMPSTPAPALLPDEKEEPKKDNSKKEESKKKESGGISGFLDSFTAAPEPEMNEEEPQSVSKMKALRKSKATDGTSTLMGAIAPVFEPLKPAPETEESKVAEAKPKNEKEGEDSGFLSNVFKPFFEGGTRFQPIGSAERLTAESGSVNFSFADNQDLIIRGQAPEKEPVPRGGTGVVTTADALKAPLKIDPELADRWQNLGGLHIGDRVPKDLPDDEYIIVGGDAVSEAFAMPNWDVHNLEADETIAQFDTVSGQIKIEPSNRFIIYMPRFASVRQIVGPRSQSQNTRLGSMDADLVPIEERNAEGVDFRSQEERTSSTRGEVQTSDMRANQPGGELVTEEGLIEETQKVLTASANGMLREETVSDRTRLDLAQGASAAAAWGKTQGVTVAIDKVAAQGNVTLQGAATIYAVTNETKTSQLRLFKSASKQEAKPGELIEFVIRYENVGTEVIGNVTILDSLSARLQYVDDSAISSKKAEFLVKNNETGSLLLRLEVTDPLEPGDYGVLTFLCKVR